MSTNNPANPAKKLPAKKAAKKAAAKKAAPTPAKKTAKPSKPSDGTYPWLLNRFKEAVVKLAPEEQQKELRNAIKDADGLKAVIKIVGKEPYNFDTEPGKLVDFFHDFVAAGVTHPGGKKE